MCDMCPEPPPERWSIEELRKEMEHRYDRAARFMVQADREIQEAENFRKIIRKKLRSGE